MERIEAIVDEAMTELQGQLSDDQMGAVSKVIKAAIVKGLLEGQHRAIDACNDCGEAEQDLAHKIATTIRHKNDVLIANLSSMR